MSYGRTGKAKSCYEEIQTRNEKCTATDPTQLGLRATVSKPSLSPKNGRKQFWEAKAKSWISSWGLRLWSNWVRPRNFHPGSKFAAFLKISKCVSVALESRLLVLLPGEPGDCDTLATG